MTINILQFLLGMIFLYYGAEFLINSSQTIAIKFNISPVILGITLVAFGTSLPELIVSIIANLKGEPGIAIGNVMGSNVANIGLVLGITTIFKSLYISFEKIRYEMYFLVGITCLPLYFIIIGGFVFWQGMVLLFTLIIYCAYLINNNQLVDDKNKGTIDKNSLFLMIKAIIGISGLVVGATLFVEGSKGIALALGVSSLVIGMSIVALGTSLPELAASLTAAKHGESDLIMGNIIGSNIINIVLVLGIAILFNDFPVDFSEIMPQGFFMVILTIGIFVLLKWKGGITKLFGIIMAFIYILFIYINFQYV